MLCSLWQAVVALRMSAACTQESTCFVLSSCHIPGKQQKMGLGPSLAIIKHLLKFSSPGPPSLSSLSHSGPAMKQDEGTHFKQHHWEESEGDRNVQTAERLCRWMALTEVGGEGTLGRGGQPTSAWIAEWLQTSLMLLFSLPLQLLLSSNPFQIWNLHTMSWADSRRTSTDFISGESKNLVKVLHTNIYTQTKPKPLWHVFALVTGWNY